MTNLLMRLTRVSLPDPNLNHTFCLNAIRRRSALPGQVRLCLATNLKLSLQSGFAGDGIGVK